MTVSLFTHHAWIGGFFIVGSGAHAALFLVADYRAWSLPGLERLLAHRHPRHSLDPRQGFLCEVGSANYILHGTSSHQRGPFADPISQPWVHPDRSLRRNGSCPHVSPRARSAGPRHLGHPTNTIPWTESSTYLMGWLRDYLWFNSSQLINGYSPRTCWNCSIWGCSNRTQMPPGKPPKPRCLTPRYRSALPGPESVHECRSAVEVSNQGYSLRAVPSPRPSSSRRLSALPS